MFKKLKTLYYAHATALPVLALALIIAISPGDALAAGEGDDSLGLGELLDWLVGLMQGALGKILAISAFLAGMITGVLKGSFMAIGVGIGFAVVMYYGPNLILNVFGAAL